MDDRRVALLEIQVRFGAHLHFSRQAEIGRKTVAGAEGIFSAYGIAVDG